MNGKILTLLAASCLAAGVASAGGNQTPQSSQQLSSAQSTGQPAASQAIAPAAASQAPDKKVWTNEDMTDLRDHSAISTVGNAPPKPAKPGDKPSPVSKGKNAAWYRDQIDKLQAKIPPLDDKIHDLQAALSGEQVTETRQYGGARPDDWRDQLDRLQKQRDEIVAKISALIDEARHNGVPANALP
jgi:hypothetical protein